MSVHPLIQEVAKRSVRQTDFPLLSSLFETIENLSDPYHVPSAYITKACQVVVVQDMVQEWLDKQGNERCWYYPDIFNKICEVLNLKCNVDRGLPLEQVFRRNCDKFTKEEYSKIDVTAYCPICKVVLIRLPNGVDYRCERCALIVEIKTTRK